MEDNRREVLRPAIEHIRKRYFAKGGIAEDMWVDQHSKGYSVHISYATRGYKEHIIKELVSLGFDATLSTTGRINLESRTRFGSP